MIEIIFLCVACALCGAVAVWPVARRRGYTQGYLEELERYLAYKQGHVDEYWHSRKESS